MLAEKIEAFRSACVRVEATTHLYSDALNCRGQPEKVEICDQACACLGVSWCDSSSDTELECIASNVHGGGCVAS